MTIFVLLIIIGVRIYFYIKNIKNSNKDDYMSK